MKTPVYLAGTLLILGAGCGGVVQSTDESSATEGALRGGDLTFDRPEVGVLFTNGALCTATLVSPNVVLTASHCFAYESADTPGNPFGTFSIFPASGTQVDYQVDGFHAFGVRGGPDEHDIAVARLIKRVGETLPAQLASSKPADGTEVTTFGFGCNNNALMNDARTGTKQKITYAYGSTHALCPGDSGGPTFFWDYGPIFQISVAIDDGGKGKDLFGDVVGHRPEIDAQIAAWAQVPCGDVGPEGTCNGDTLLRCDPDRGLLSTNCSADFDFLTCGVSAAGAYDCVSVDSPPPSSNGAPAAG